MSSSSEEFSSETKNNSTSKGGAISDKTNSLNLRSSAFMNSKRPATTKLLCASQKRLDVLLDDNKNMEV